MLATIYNLLSGPGLLVILLAVIFFFGGKKIPALARALVRSVSEFRHGKQLHADSGIDAPEQRGKNSAPPQKPS